MTDRVDQIQRAFEALDGGDVSGFRDLFIEGAQWQGIPGSGWEGETPT